MKTHVILPDYADLNFPAAVEFKETFGKALGAFIKNSGEQAFFRQFEQGETPGQMFFLLECSDEFLERVKKMKGFGGTAEVPLEAPTVRAPKLQDFYTGKVNKPKPPKFF